MALYLHIWIEFYKFASYVVEMAGLSASVEQLAFWGHRELCGSGPVYLGSGYHAVWRVIIKSNVTLLRETKIPAHGNDLRTLFRLSHEYQNARFKNEPNARN